jgi:tetratricopeptide (TPR) repeat protein
MIRALGFLLALGAVLAACNGRASLAEQIAVEKRYFEAQKLLEKININPNLAETDDFKFAVARFQEAVKDAVALPQNEALDSVIKGSLLRIAQLELMHDNVDGAVAAYEELLRRFPRDDELGVSARLTIGLLHERTLEYGEAIASYALVLPSLAGRLTAQEPEAYLLSLPFHFARLNKFDLDAGKRNEAYRRARQVYETLLAKFPKSKTAAAAVAYLAALLADQEQWQDLDRFLHQQTARHAGSEDLPRIVYAHALALHERLGETARARAMLEELLEKYPEHELALQARFEIGRILMRQDQAEAARLVLKEVVKKGAQQPGLAARAQEEIAMSYEREGQWPQALNEYRWLAKEYETLPPSLGALLRIANHYANENNAQLAQQAYKDAVNYYQSLIAKYPRSMIAALAQEHIANCFVAQRRWDEAAAAAAGIEDILDNSVGKVSTYILLGSIYESAGHTERALKVYGEFVRNFPQHPLAGAMEQKIQTLRP